MPDTEPQPSGVQLGQRGDLHGEVSDVAGLPPGGEGLLRPRCRGVRSRLSATKANRSAIIEFVVDDVDTAYEELLTGTDEVVAPPTTMPWGNRALLVRDSDGTLVNLFTPVSDDAVAKFTGISRL